jgi:hypothetical protein
MFYIFHLMVFPWTVKESLLELYNPQHLKNMNNKIAHNIYIKLNIIYLMCCTFVYCLFCLWGQDQKDYPMSIKIKQRMLSTDMDIFQVFVEETHIYECDNFLHRIGWGHFLVHHNHNSQILGEKQSLWKFNIWWWNYRPRFWPASFIKRVKINTNLQLVKSISTISHFICKIHIIH